MSETQLDQTEKDLTAAGRFFNNFEQTSSSVTWLERQLGFAEAFYDTYKDLLHEDYGVVAQLADGKLPRTLTFDARRNADRQFLWQLNDASGDGRFVQQLLVRPSGIKYVSCQFDSQGNMVVARRSGQMEALALSRNILDFLRRPENTAEIDALADRKARAMARLVAESFKSEQEFNQAKENAARIGFLALEPYSPFPEINRGPAPGNGLPKGEAPNYLAEATNDIKAMPYSTGIRDLSPEEQETVYRNFVFDLIERLPDIQAKSEAAKAELAALGEEAMENYDKELRKYISGAPKTLELMKIDRLIEQAARYDDAVSAIHKAGRREAAALCEALRGWLQVIDGQPYWPVHSKHGEAWLCTTDELSEDRIYFNRFDAIEEMDGRAAKTEDYMALLRGLWVVDNDNSVAA